MKNLGYATGQFGKNHLGDPTSSCRRCMASTSSSATSTTSTPRRNLRTPTTRRVRLRKKFGPRGVLHCWATETEDETVDPQFGKVGKQKIENTGALSTKRMETIDDEFTDAAWVGSRSKRRPARLSSATTTRPGCTFSLTSRRNHRARRDWVSIPTAWSNTMRTSASPEETRRSGCRGEHDRCLHHRQRGRMHDVAGRRHDTLQR